MLILLSRMKQEQIKLVGFSHHECGFFMSSPGPREILQNVFPNHTLRLVPNELEGSWAT